MKYNKRLGLQKYGGNLLFMKWIHDGKKKGGVETKSLGIVSVIQLFL